MLPLINNDLRSLGGRRRELPIRDLICCNQPLLACRVTQTSKRMNLHQKELPLRCYESNHLWGWVGSLDLDRALRNKSHKIRFQMRSEWYTSLNWGACGLQRGWHANKGILPLPDTPMLETFRECINNCGPLGCPCVMFLLDATLWGGLSDLPIISGTPIILGRCVCSACTVLESSEWNFIAQQCFLPLTFS